MKKLLTLLLLAFSLTVFAQDEKQFYSKDFNWRMDVAPEFSSLSENEVKYYQKRGEDLIEKSTDTKVESNVSVIFSMRSTQVDYLEANYQPFEEAVDGKFESSITTVKDMMVETFEKSIGTNLNITSKISKEQIDGLEFYVTEIVVPLPNKATITTLMYSRLFGKRDFSELWCSSIPKRESKCWTTGANRRFIEW